MTKQQELWIRARAAYLQEGICRRAARKNPILIHHSEAAHYEAMGYRLPRKAQR